MNQEAQEMVGGQAVIEGVMMRSPQYVSVAVRRPNGKIALKREPYTSWTKRYKWLGLPFFRGGVILIESMILGVKALNFSSEIAMEEEKDNKEKKEKSSLWMKMSMAFTMIFAFVLGLALFFYLPLLITEWTGVEGGILFNLVDGAIRLVFFLVYLGLISLWKEIRRVFQYHGAEHKSIFAYENKKPLSIEGAKGFKTFHPRCGTSFLLIVMLVSLIVFMILGKPDTVAERVVRFLFIPVIGGISYELIRLSGKAFGMKLGQILVAPGLWLQKITTKEPDESQLEVGLVALKSALDLELDIPVDWINN